MRRTARLFVLVLGLALAAPAAAQTEVLIYHGNNGYNTSMNTFINAMYAAGATNVSQTGTWPASLSSYRVVLLFVPQTDYDSGQRADIQAYATSGRVLVLVSEHSGFYPASLTILNQLMSDLGGDSYFEGGLYDCGCNVGTVVGYNDFTNGVATCDFGCYSRVITAGVGMDLIQGPSGNVVVASEDNIVLAGDSNFFDDTCLGGDDNEQFFDNLFDYQGCDDLDGDGYLDHVCGGDDCDDGDPDVNPGATDVVNKVDDDCNGWADERIVCPDGSAEFLTIQEAADAAADGTTILLCEGEYEGGIVLKGRQLSIRGNTSDPSAVTVGAGSGRALDIDGGAVEISWLSLTTETAQVIASASNGRLSMDTVRFVASETWQSLELGSMSSVEISRSYFEPGSYVDGDGIASLVMTYNIFDGAGVGSFSDGDLEIHHNLVVGSSWLSLDGSESDINCSFYNNTVADLDEWSIYLTWYSYPDFPQVRVFDNIFAFIDSGTLYSVRWVCYSICSYDISDVAPQRFSDNVIFQVPEPLSNVTYYWYSGGHYEGYITDDSLSEDIEYDNIFADPDFEHNFKGERSYTLSSDSIAAGKGAIGGDEEGNWWNEVPWDLPESGVWL